MPPCPTLPLQINLQLSMSENISVIILAAGKGTRMKSELPKVMHKVAGREMLNMVIDEAKTLNPKNITIVASDEITNFQAHILEAHPDIHISFAMQKERNGTAHAVSTGLATISDLGEKTLVLYGDTPLVSRNTLKTMVTKLDEAALCILGFEDQSPNSYGRLVIDREGNLEKIVEFKDANAAEKEIFLCNSGVMAIDGKEIKNFLDKVDNHNAAKEFYLTDIVAIAEKMNLKRAFIRTTMNEVLGANSRSELARVERIKQQQLRQKMMDSGVTLIDPESIHFAFDTKISHDVIIHPHVVFGPGVEIASNSDIKSFSHIEGAIIASHVAIGPFARIRPGAEIADDVRIGNFVEVKKSQIKKGAKINHLSYVGDSEIGEESNIGAGTITCNYDGHHKSKTTIGKRVFVGSNSALVAPIDIKDGAVIGAGSVITKNVEANDLAVTRAKQITLPQGGKKFHQTKSKK